MDIAVLEWCKLFVDRRGVHCYRNVLINPDGFEAELLADLEMSAADFETYCTGVRTYRDKFVAHLDDDPKAKYPQLDVAIKSTKFLYNYCVDTKTSTAILMGFPAT